ncbi:MAG: caspase family protein [Hyphomicrobiaceae bacterium]
MHLPFGRAIFHVLFAAAVCLVAVLAPPAIAETRRVALVIGNSAYSSVSELTNPKNDAAAVAETLRAIGFDEVRESLDLTQSEFRRALRDFTALARTADVALVYYAGHGVEVGGRNFLVPTDATLAEATDTEFEAIPLDNVRTAVSGARNLRLVILDACRNNPFKLASAGGSRAVGRGLARVEPGANEIVAYAAREGTVASDGDGTVNSPYATALVKYMQKPGLEVRLMFGNVRDEVLAATGRTQEPFTYGTLGGQPIYLNAPAGTSETSPVTPPAQGDDLNKRAADAWITVKDTTSVAILKAYIAKFEGTIFADLAAARLAEIMAAQPPSAPEAGSFDATPETADPVGEQVAVGPIIDDSENVALAQPQELTIAPSIYPVGKWAEGMAFDGKRIWVAESGQRTVGAYDLDGNLLSRVKVGRLPVEVENLPNGPAYSLQRTDSTIWVHPRDGGKSKRVTGVGKCPSGLAVGRTALWVLSWPDCSSADSLVTRIDLKSGKKADSARLGTWAEAIAFGHGAAWVAEVSGGRMTRVDQSSLALESIPIDGASIWSVLVTDRAILAAGRLADDNSQGLVVAVDPDTRTVTQRQSLSELVLRIAADDRHVVVVGLQGTIWVLSADSLAIERKISLGIGEYRPSDALIIGERLYVVAQQMNGENGALLAVDGWRPSATASGATAD